jgi:hypothetical protein
VERLEQAIREAVPEWSLAEVATALQADKQLKVAAAPRCVRAIAWKAQTRLCGRFRSLIRQAPDHRRYGNCPRAIGPHLGDQSRGHGSRARDPPDRPQRDAVLATLKAWPGDSRWRRQRTPRRPALTTAAPGVPAAARVGTQETGSQVEQRNWLGRSWRPQLRLNSHQSCSSEGGTTAGEFPDGFMWPIT